MLCVSYPTPMGRLRDDDEEFSPEPVYYVTVETGDFYVTDDGQNYITES